MPEREDVEFQIRLLRIQIMNEILTEFYVAMIAIGVATLLSLGVSIGVAGQYNLWVVLSQTVAGVVFVFVVYIYWRRHLRRIDEEIENLRRRFAPT